MAIWMLETDNDLTTFNFPIEEDKQYFHELVHNYFDESKPIGQNWHLLTLLRKEPKKHPDFFEIDNTDVLAISEKAAHIFSISINNKIELLPIDTDAGRYYALNVFNFVDCLDRSGSIYITSTNGIIVSYSSLEFNDIKLNRNAIFKIPEMPYHIFLSDSIQEHCEENFLRGLTFDPKSNLIWYP